VEPPTKPNGPLPVVGRDDSGTPALRKAPEPPGFELKAPPTKRRR